MQCHTGILALVGVGVKRIGMEKTSEFLVEIGKLEKQIQELTYLLYKTSLVIEIDDYPLEVCVDNNPSFEADCLPCNQTRPYGIKSTTSSLLSANTW